MPPTMDRMLEAIGRNAMELTEGMFRINTGPGAARAHDEEPAYAHVL
jgi:hypothetical protein